MHKKIANLAQTILGEGATANHVHGAEAGSQLGRRARRGQVKLGQDHDWTGAAVPGDDELALHTRRGQAVTRRRDQHHIDVGGQHLANAVRVEAPER